MSKMKLSNSTMVRAQLLDEIRNGLYSNLHKLPPEEELAEQLKISRTQLRDILASLEAEGYISRSRGVGTIINKHVLNAKTRIDIGTEFMSLIKQTGAEPGLAFTNVVQEFCDLKAATKLELRENTPIYKIERMVTANGRKVIYCEDHFSFQIIKKDNYTQADLEKPVFTFLEEFCDVKVHMNLTTLKPMVTDDRLSELFQLKKGTPLLYIDEVSYNFDGEPLLWSSEYYVDDVFEHTVLRKWV